jgi:hypothetical protein
MSACNSSRASLEQAVGGGFFPGIEAGIRLTYPGIYSSKAPFRLKKENEKYQHKIVDPQSDEVLDRTLVAGHITERMAVPWQADFFYCKKEGGTKFWWPSQRPDNFADDVTATSASPAKPWFPGTVSQWFAQKQWFQRPFIKPTATPTGKIIHLADAND